MNDSDSDSDSETSSNNIPQNIIFSDTDTDSDSDSESDLESESESQPDSNLDENNIVVDSTTNTNITNITEEQQDEFKEEIYNLTEQDLDEYLKLRKLSIKGTHREKIDKIMEIGPEFPSNMSEKNMIDLVDKI